MYSSITPEVSPLLNVSVDATTKDIFATEILFAPPPIVTVIPYAGIEFKLF